MRILIVSPRLKLDSTTGIIILEYLKYMRDLELYIYWPVPQESKRLTKLGAKVLGHVNCLHPLVELKEYLRKYDFHVIEMNSIFEPFLLVKHLKPYLSKIIIVRHGVIELPHIKYETLNSLGALIKEVRLRLVAKKFYGFIALSRYMYRELRRRFNPNNIALIPNPVDTSFFKLPSSNYVTELHPTLLFVGKLVKIKGVDILVKSMPYVLKKWPNARLIVVGEGPLKHYLFKLAMELHICKHIAFLGYIPHTNLPKIYANSDIFITASYVESFCLPAIEAMSCGKPLIARDVYGLSEHILMSRASVALHNDKPESIVSAINYVMYNYEELSKNARKYALNFDSKKVANIKKSLYKNIASTS